MDVSMHDGLGSIALSRGCAMATAAIADTQQPTLPVRLEASPAQRYRLLKHGSARWDVQAEIGVWHTVYSDDSARRAFDELKRRAKLGGCVVCARCGWEVDPRLRNGQVLCEICHALAAPVEWLPIFALSAVCVVWLGLMCYLGHLVHMLTAGGVN